MTIHGVDKSDVKQYINRNIEMNEPEIYGTMKSIASNF